MGQLTLPPRKCANKRKNWFLNRKQERQWGHATAVRHLSNFNAIRSKPSLTLFLNWFNPEIRQNFPHINVKTKKMSVKLSSYRKCSIWCSVFGAITQVTSVLWSRSFDMAGTSTESVSHVQVKTTYVQMYTLCKLGMCTLVQMHNTGCNIKCLKCVAALESQCWVCLCWIGRFECYLIVNNNNNNNNNNRCSIFHFRHRFAPVSSLTAHSNVMSSVVYRTNLSLSHVYWHRVETTCLLNSLPQ